MPIDPAFPFSLNPHEAAIHRDADLARRVSTLERRQMDLKNWTEDWHNVGTAGEPSFASPWNNGTAAVNGPTRFRKHPSGLVQLAGGPGTSAPVNSDEIFTLPAAYQPEYRLSWPMWATPVSPGVPFIGELTVETNGDVVFWSNTFQFDFVHLSGVSFPV